MATKVLFVEDEERLRMNVQVFLEMNGFEVVVAADGVEGLEKLKTESPDLVVTDVMMPRMDGFTMLKEIRSDDATRSLPIIMLTAKESIRDLYELEGANEFIPKPFDMNDLVQAINRLVSS